jgi:hypothetical protein
MNNVLQRSAVAYRTANVRCGHINSRYSATTGIILFFLKFCITRPTVVVRQVPCQTAVVQYGAKLAISPN